MRFSVRIGTAEFRVDTRMVETDGRIVAIEPRAAGVLLELVKRPGEVLSRETLLQSCWDDLEGSDEALTQAIAQLRRAFSDKATDPRYIQTIRKSGYRLIAPVEKDVVRNRELARSPLAQSRTDSALIRTWSSRRNILGPRIAFTVMGAAVVAAALLLLQVETEQIHFVKTG